MGGRINRGAMVNGPAFPEKQVSSQVIALAKQVEFQHAEKRKRKSKDEGDGKKSNSKKTNEELSKYVTHAHTTSKEALEAEYETCLTDDKKYGLTSEKVKELREKYGENKLTPPYEHPRWVKLLICIFEGFFNQLLWAGSILCFVAYGAAKGDLKDITYFYLGVVLAAVVTMTGCFSFYQEAKSDDIMSAFKNLEPDDVECWRDGKISKISPRGLVPGDVVNVMYGMKMPADLRIIQCSPDTEVDNASLTGESEAQKRKWTTVNDEDANPMEAENLLFFGTSLLKGKGQGMVFNTGDNTLMGQIAAL